MSMKTPTRLVHADRAAKKPKKTWTYIPDINPTLSSLEKFLRENEVGGEVKDGSSVQVSH